MKTIIVAAATSVALATGAVAADFGVVNQPVPVGYSTTNDWSGFYAGIFGGVTNGPFDYSFVPTGLPSMLDISVNSGGLIGGGLIGYDVQFDKFVLGVAADLAATNHRAEVTVDVPAVPFSANATSRLTHLGTVRARAGYAFDNLLAYVHGGVAYGRTETEIVVGGVPLPGLQNNDRWGYTVGAGVEFAVTENVSLQTEYSWTDLGTENVYSDPGGTVPETVGLHSLKAGVNFRF